MARKKSSPAEDLMDIVSWLPWWVGLGLAVASYLVLHRIALTPPPASLQPGQVGNMVVGMLFAALAQAGQYLLLLLCCLGAAISFFRRKTRQQSLSLVQEGGNEAADFVNGMSWQNFEMLVGEAFRQQGWRVIEVGGGGADGGVDLVLLRGKEKHLVQCKQWKAFKVGVGVVRELYGVMAAQGAAGGYVVTSGQFTREAKEFAQGRNVELVDGPGLLKLIGSARPLAPAKEKLAPSRLEPTLQESEKATCPLCQAPMLKRTARQGPNQGRTFWGCSAYPKCRGTRAV